MLKKTVIIVACIVGIGILYFANPEYTVWAPKCLFYKLTGFQCPACGTQRALHQLLHCNFTGAFHYNSFLIISMPYLTSLVAVCWFDTGNRLKKLRDFVHNTTTVNTYLMLLVLWWIARNVFHLSN
jgi:hypothetical protein